jgi:hypothetical protein
MTSAFRERLKWLGRMPRHFRILLGSQLVFALVVMDWRMKALKKMERKEVE